MDKQAPRRHTPLALFLLFLCVTLAIWLPERCLLYLCFTICKMGFFPHVPFLPYRDAVGFWNGCDVTELIGSPPHRTVVISSNRGYMGAPRWQLTYFVFALTGILEPPPPTLVSIVTEGSNKIRHLRGINKICDGVGGCKVFMATCLGRPA